MSEVITSPAVAGYHMLMILAEVDGSVEPEEKKVIRAYLEERYPLQLDPTYEAVFMDAMDRGHYEDLFSRSAMDYYVASTEEERNSFLQFAFNVIMADEQVTREENRYINLLYDIWQLDATE